MSDAKTLGEAIVTALNAATFSEFIAGVFAWRPVVDLADVPESGALVIVSPSGKSVELESRADLLKSVTLQVSVLGKLAGDDDRPDDLSALTDEIELWLPGVSVSGWSFFEFATDDATATEVLVAEALETQDVFQSLTLATYRTLKAL